MAEYISCAERIDLEGVVSMGEIVVVLQVLIAVSNSVIARKEWTTEVTSNRDVRNKKI